MCDFDAVLYEQTNKTFISKRYKLILRADPLHHSSILIDSFVWMDVERMKKMYEKFT